LRTTDFVCHSIILEEAHPSSDREDPIGEALRAAAVSMLHPEVPQELACPI
jgi:hypothetical protein